jgi:ribosomal protein S11
VPQKIIIVSDLSGKEVLQEEAGTLYIRKGKGVDKARAFDIVAEDVAGLIEAPDIYLIGIKMNGDFEEKELVISAKELMKLVPDGEKLEDMISNARYSQGRRPQGR